MARTYTESEVVERIKRETQTTSLRRVARQIGVSAGYLSDIINGNRAVSDNMALAFGFERETKTTVVFRKKEE
jgi:plasmid maintenance system antidote protein VapI